ncbi:cysteine--tRNA ligase [Tepidibacillus fermentans]|uniref:Cysteine--tRNA ligase n=1 Tax=Tepidibacillus fermentans TaxID=1281767 RepID=A0A4R3KF16_9BACI|nr:cysteine--tRNA ligase [Tepidibacillus fermentans]TCS81569.1 cysteinyl-tRNA synthetase [Tepidibacillus fermentans]
MIRIYNTLTRRKEIFQSIKPGKVKMYVCGPTVYNYIHLGNARPLVVFDTVRRYLEYKGYNVTYVQNFTDIDDKIINKAKEMGESPLKISEQYIQEFFVDADALGVKRASIHPKVTENMGEIIHFIQDLLSQDLAYIVNGDVYFRTNRFKGYGKLSHQSIQDLQAGARVEVDEKKDNPLDFALWKAAKLGEIAWDSPWGEGRPGWHIECSAMVRKYMGETIDIHAGGADLIFPHHENEIAQSESIHHKPLANYWMHNGYININDEKMSKSLGNVLTIHDLIQKVDPLVLRFLLLSVHYRHPINFTDDLLEQSKNGLERIKIAYLNLSHRLADATTQEKRQIDIETLGLIEQLHKQFEKEMDDDFHTANAITVIYELIKQGNLYLQNKVVHREIVQMFMDKLELLLEVLGLDKILEKNEAKKEDVHWIEQLIEQRQIARKNKDWALADQIRNQLAEAGIILEDTPQGVRWRKK